jgi:hypothetical protein
MPVHHELYPVSPDWNAPDVATGGKIGKLPSIKMLFVIVKLALSNATFSNIYSS